MQLLIIIPIHMAMAGFIVLGKVGFGFMVLPLPGGERFRKNKSLFTSSYDLSSSRLIPRTFEPLISAADELPMVSARQEQMTQYFMVLELSTLVTANLTSSKF
jgi:hypothetical protein